MILNKEATYIFARRMCENIQQSVYVYSVPVGNTTTYMYGIHGTQQKLQETYKRPVTCIGRFDWTSEGIKEYV